jgi:AcrR family transcriptional regulator
MEENLDKPFRISDLERITGLRRRTIHYYLQEGLLSPPKRTGKTMAYYGAIHIEELMRIGELRKKGYPIALIREELRAERPAVRQSGDNSGAKSDRKRQLILEAVNVFSRKGYNQTKITDITSAVGIGQSTFYIYFPSKKALFLECVDQVFDAMFKDVWEEIKNEKNPLQRLRKRYEVVTKSHPQFIDMLQVLHMAVEDDPRLDAKRREIYTSVYDTVKHDVNHAVEMGLLHPKPSEKEIELMSHIFVGFLETAHFILTMYPHYSEDDLMDALLELSRFDFSEPERK